MRKFERVCSACKAKVPARFRTVVNEHLCEPCWEFWLTFHRMPTIEDLLTKDDGYE